jgi:hypothetical protein
MTNMPPEYDDDELDDDNELDEDDNLDRNTLFQTHRQDTNSKIGCLIVWALGMALAVNISWDLNHSVLWGALHGLLSWIYVVFYYFAK